MVIDVDGEVVQTPIGLCFQRTSFVSNGLHALHLVAPCAAPRSSRGGLGPSQPKLRHLLTLSNLLSLLTINQSLSFILETVES